MKIISKFKSRNTAYRNLIFLKVPQTDPVGFYFKKGRIDC